MAGVYENMRSLAASGGGGLAVHLDPDKIPPDELRDRTELIGRHADFIFVGGSVCAHGSFATAVGEIKAASRVPVVIFPGDSTQVSANADAILFLSLVSGRNPDLLIGEHVKAAPIIRGYGLEVIPVAYILIESGRMTSVQFMSQTIAVPRNKPEIAMAHALAGQYLGMKLVFLEAGSGADNPVPPDMVRAVSGYVSIPVMVGGGIRAPETARALVEAGASFIVTGDVLERRGSQTLLEQFGRAVHDTCHERG